VSGDGWGPWAAHRQSSWLLRARDRRFPLHQRVWFVALGSHARNGHAPLAPGQLAALLATVHAGTGELDPPPAQAAISHAISRAREMGLVDPRSSSRCLIVQPADVRGGIGRRGPCTTCDLQIAGNRGGKGCKPLATELQIPGNVQRADQRRRKFPLDLYSSLMLWPTPITGELIS
jgi:hypothetical protein